MKNVFISASLLIITLFTACDKKAALSIQPKLQHPSPVALIGVSDITGKWHPVGVSGLNGEPEAMSDISWHYVFNADSTYVHYLSPQSQNTGTFHIGRQQSIVDGKIYSSISFNGSTEKSILTLKNDTLTISDNYTGGSKFFFIRFN
jgi:hypothetical protein